MCDVAILSVDSPLETQAIRAFAETLNFTVSVTWVGNSHHVTGFFEKVRDDAHQKVVFISAHGDERGLLLPELAPQVEQQFPYREVIRPEDFASFVDLNGEDIVNLSCLGGTEAMASAFLTAGAGSYVGATGYVQGSSTVMYAVQLVHGMHSRLDLEAAHRAASHYPDDRSQFNRWVAP